MSGTWKDSQYNYNYQTGLIWNQSLWDNWLTLSVAFECHKCPMTDEFAAQRASNAENVSIPWCYHDAMTLRHPVKYSAEGVMHIWHISNDHPVIYDHQRFYCSYNSFSKQICKKNQSSHNTDPLRGESLVSSGFPAHGVSNAGNT